MPDSLSAARRFFALGIRPLRLGKHFALGNCTKDATPPKPDRSRRPLLSH
jgi:hypothetical protein